MTAYMLVANYGQANTTPSSNDSVSSHSKESIPPSRIDSPLVVPNAKITPPSVSGKSSYIVPGREKFLPWAAREVARTEPALPQDESKSVQRHTPLVGTDESLPPCAAFSNNDSY